MSNPEPKKSDHKKERKHILKKFISQTLSLLLTFALVFSLALNYASADSYTLDLGGGYKVRYDTPHEN